MTKCIPSAEIDQLLGLSGSLPVLAPGGILEVFRHVHAGILLTDASFRIVALNPAITRVSGYSSEELIGHSPAIFKSGQHDAAFFERMARHLESQGHWSGIVCNRHKEGRLYHQQLSIQAIRASNGKLSHYLGVFSEPGTQDSDYRTEHNLAHFDVLTGLPNRLLLADRIEQAIVRNSRTSALLAVCFLDLDGFKLVNDTLGHGAGDQLLKEISSRLLHNLRSSDTVARLGGDEFAIVLADLGSEAECFQTLDRLLREIAAPYQLGENRQSLISASIGVTLVPHDNGDAEQLLHHADHAMYAAKQAGKNCYQLFDARMEQRIQSRQDTLLRVARSLRAGHFELHYQPSVDVREHRVVGLEALIRWNHPILGSLSPKEFIPLVEDDELALRLGSWVIQTALNQARQWHEQGIQFPVSVNVFPRQLIRPEFPRHLAELITDTWPNMPAGRLVLEFVESVKPHVLEPMRRNLQACRELHVGFALDDFGTGASSLNSLRLLEPETVKIYQSFVRDMAGDTGTAAVVKGSIDLCHAFAIQVVAEGIETAAQQAELLALGCNVMQGHHLGRPMPASRFPAWLNDFSSRTD